MRQLTSLDATFLSIESPTVVGHVCGLTVLDPSTTKSGSLTLEDTRALLEKRMHLLPPFRWRLVQVPFDLDNPYAAKERHSAVPATLLQDLSRFVPPAVAARAGRVVERVLVTEQGPPPVNVIISNVPGPQFPLYSAGARVIANYPVSAITHGVGLNMTVQSYDGHLDFGLVACRELVPDLAKLIGYLRDALDELLAARPDASK